MLLILPVTIDCDCDYVKRDFNLISTVITLVCVYIRHSLPVKRDMEERERTLDHILAQYTTFVKPAFEEFCQPVRESNTFACYSLLFICT